MSVEHVEVLVEEPSMEAALRALLPRLLGEVSFEVYLHQGKQDLLKRLPDRLRGYAKWLPPSYRVVVVVDRDNEDCRKLKTQLETMAAEAGLVTRAASKERKIEAARAIAAHMDPDRNRSPSFCALRDVLREIAGEGRA